MSEETKEPLEETPVTAETAETEQEKTPENQEFNDGSIKAIAQQMSQWIAEHQV